MDTRSEWQRKVDRAVFNRVQKAVKELERVYGPDWVEQGAEVWEKYGFDIRSSDRCVLGGLSREYHRGKLRMGLNDNDASKLGFYVSDADWHELRVPGQWDGTYVWDALQREWENVLGFRHGR